GSPPMQAALKLHTTVLPGHRIEVATPDLPEGAAVELVIYPLPVGEQTRSDWDSPVPSDSRYPSALDIEYESLIQIQWQRTLTEDERTRLEAIKAEMNALDTASHPNMVWDQQIANIHRQLAAIRQEVESLPDAS